MRRLYVIHRRDGGKAKGDVNKRTKRR